MRGRAQSIDGSRGPLINCDPNLIIDALIASTTFQLSMTDDKT